MMLLSPRSSSSLFVIVVALLGAASLVEGSLSNSSRFAGKWTDRTKYGVTLDMCVGFNGLQYTLSGFYSGVGVLRGIITGGDTFSGYWFEGGLSNSWGPVKFVLGADGSSFTGTYASANDFNQFYTWSEMKISDDEPSHEECLFFDQSNPFFNLAGKTWYGDNVTTTICDGFGQEYLASLHYGIFTGTSYGVVQAGYHMGTWAGTKDSIVLKQGTNLNVPYESGQMANVWWTPEGLSGVPRFIDNPSEHGVNIFTGSDRKKCPSF